MIRAYIGYDHRQPVSFHVLAQSIIENTSVPVEIIPLILPTLPLKRQGLTPFTFSRFLVPYLNNYQGKAIFMDSDIVLRGDIAELFELFDDKYAVQVAKSKAKFEWASVILFNCGHESNRVLTPEYIETASGLHGIEWLKDEEIGSIPDEWNHLVGYDEEDASAKLIHYTQGVPFYDETAFCEHAETWRHYMMRTGFSVPWVELMGESVHSVDVNGKRLPKFLFDLEKQMPKPQFDGIVRKLLGG